MNRRRAESQGSLGPDDEVMPYSDDETDDEVEQSTDGEMDEPAGAPQPQAAGGETLQQLLMMMMNDFISVVFSLNSILECLFCQSIIPGDTVFNFCTQYRGLRCDLA